MSKKKVKSTGKPRVGVRPARGNALPTPEPSEVGKVLGKAFADVLTRKVRAQSNIQGEDKKVNNPLVNPEVAQARQVLPMLDVRTPDAQYILWTFRDLKPQDAGFDRDPLITKISVPTEATWTWVVSSVISVVAHMNWETSEYRVSVPFSEPLKRISGDARAAKKFAEALLSASDWKVSHRTVLGDAVDRVENWGDYAPTDSTNETKGN